MQCLSRKKDEEFLQFFVLFLLVGILIFILLYGRYAVGSGEVRRSRYSANYSFSAVSLASGAAGASFFTRASITNVAKTMIFAIPTMAEQIE